MLDDVRDARTLRRIPCIRKVWPVKSSVRLYRPWIAGCPAS